MLTNLQIKNAKPTDKPYKLFDGGGLFILVHPNGSKYWRQKYYFNGHEHVLSIGVYPDISLGDARAKREEIKQKVREGVNPKAEKNTPLNTFSGISTEWYLKMVKQWSPKHAKTIRSRLDKYILPFIGNLQLKEIKPPVLVDLLNRFQNAGLLETAKRVRVIIGQVFTYAVQIGVTEYNPAFAMRGVVATPKVKHMPALLTPKSVGEYLRLIDDYSGSLQTKYALKLLPLVFVRPTELRHAEWAEIDFDSKEWRIPAHKMKMKEMHTVPLSNQAIEILLQLKEITGVSKYVFPSTRTNDRPMSDNTVTASLRRLGYQKGEVTAHGFRATASTLLNELGYMPDVIERQLAHADRNKVRSAYNRSEYMKERRAMMQEWADYLDKLKSES